MVFFFEYCLYYKRRLYYKYSSIYHAASTAAGSLTVGFRNFIVIFWAETLAH